MSAAPLFLLGPQRHVRTVGEAFQRVAPTGTIVTVTAGWQEREAEDVELHEFVDERTVNLALHRRAEVVWRDDPAYRTAHRSLQDQLRLLRRSYQIRLAHLMQAWRDVESLEGDVSVLGASREAALEAVRTLDAQHLAQIRAMRAEFVAEVKPSERPGVRRARAEIAEAIRGASAVAIAGGHVAVLLNRMRMFGLDTLIDGLPVVAWSAGAMAMAERVVLFHDSPPQGPGYAEAFDNGLGLARGIVPLPHAKWRLRLEDPKRVGRLARRFAPAVCTTLDNGEGIECRDGTWIPFAGPSIVGSRRLDQAGHVAEFAA